MKQEKLDVLIACEYSGTVRDAFINQGHNAVSADLRPTESDKGPHIQADIHYILKNTSQHWDLMIAHPPCTYLSNSGVRWLHEKNGRWQDMINAAVFFRKLYNTDIPHIAVENPIMHNWGKKIIGADYNDNIQPYQFGHPKSKNTCLWLKNLPKLKPTNTLQKKGDTWKNQTPTGQNKIPPSKNRSKKRSKFFKGIAKAMAQQYPKHINQKKPR